MAKFGYSYVANEHNIDRQYLDHRSVSTYNQFSYDNLDRLTNVQYLSDLNNIEAFVMDDLGNRVGEQTIRDDGLIKSIDFVRDPFTNRYTWIERDGINREIIHDEAGNLTQDRQGYVYFYDYENRIVRIENGVGNFVASFDYDALGHRVRKIAGTVTTLYYNDPEWRVLAEYNGSGTLQRSFVWGNYIDELLRMRASESDYYYLHDHLYSPAVLIGYESGQWRPVERYEYDAYGTARVINRGPDNAWFTADDVVTGSSAINTTLFTGRTLDALDSGTLKVSYYRHRYTDPFTGRFLQQDPMNFVGDMNLYGFVVNNPIVDTDPSGLLHSAHIGLPKVTGVSEVVLAGVIKEDVWVELEVDGTVRWKFTASNPASIDIKKPFDYRWLKTNGSGNVIIRTCRASCTQKYRIERIHEVQQATKISWGPVENLGFHFVSLHAYFDYNRYFAEERGPGDSIGSPAFPIYWPLWNTGHWIASIKMVGDWFYNQEAGEGQGFLFNDISPFGSSSKRSQNQGYVKEYISPPPTGLPSFGELPVYGTIATLYHPVSGMWFVRTVPAILSVKANLAINAGGSGGGTGIERTFHFTLPGGPLR